MTAAGRRIAILRDPERAEPLRAALTEAGFEIVVRPVTQVEYLPPGPAEDWRAWTRAADWVLFTSLNGVQGFARGLGGDRALAEVLAGRRVAVLGATSAQRLEAVGVRPAIVQERGTSADLVWPLLAAMPTPMIVLYPCAEKTLPTLPEAIRAGGHDLRLVACYRTAPWASERAPFDWQELDAAVVAAPSAVEALREEPALPSSLGFFAIGPTTGAALRAAGLTVLGIAESPKVESMVALLKEWARGRHVTL
jgi:uroporphyrinogen III methyltransferase / synthase